MKFTTLRLGKDSVPLIQDINNLPNGHQLNPFKFKTKCKQVSHEIAPGSITFIWLGSDNSKGQSTAWEQGFKAVAKIIDMDLHDFQDQSTLTLEISYVFTSSLGRKDFLREDPTSYYWCSDAPIVGVDDRANQTIRIIENAEFSQVSALLRCMSSCQDNFVKEIVISFPELAEYLNYSPSDPRQETKTSLGSVDIALPGAMRNIIYFGAPGTGKSYSVSTSANAQYSSLDSNNETRQSRITFHPRYSYFQFVGSYKPTVKEVTISSTRNANETRDEISYSFVPGPLTNILVKALNNRNEQYLLIIEEINRAETASVFGDTFQLLDRDKFGNSVYPIEVSHDFSEHLTKSLTASGKEFLELITKRPVRDVTTGNITHIALPSNLALWATMNSADQGVFPLDTAFKRRWDFKYIDINEGEGNCKWNNERVHINTLLKSAAKVNEDKLMGPYFLPNHLDPRLTNGEINPEFSDSFANKVIMYLAEDAAKYSMSQITNTTLIAPNATLSDYLTAWKNHNFGIFTGLSTWRSWSQDRDSEGYGITELEDSGNSEVSFI